MKEYLKKIDDVIAQGYYKDTWESLSQKQVPVWFRKAKLGIFIHWGPYCVPAKTNEWYSRNMYIKGMPAYEYHVETYGEQKNFGYQDFIPMFTAEHFNPNEWAELIKESGANYVFPVAEHHDGFQMYKSRFSKWNAVEMGPKRDILGELKEACCEKGIVFCTSSHRAEHWFFMGHGKEFDSDIKEPMKRGDFYWPAMPEPDNSDLFSEPYPNEEFLQDWLVRTCEIIDEYQPRALYFDWWIQHVAFKPYLKKLVAYYYNRGIQWDEEVIVCYKYDAMMFGSGVVEVERGHFSDMKPFYWQTDTSTAYNSWCYTVDNEYKKPMDVIYEFIDVVSKNGNLLLNIGPKSDGTFPEQDKEILKELGTFLRQTGEAYFGAGIWKKYGEGPHKTVEGHFSENNAQEYSSEDIRFTVKENHLYATVMVFPENKIVNIRSLNRAKDMNQSTFHGIIETVEALGFEEELNWEQNENGLLIKSQTISSNYPVVFKITVN
ncbi:alpha-L-fucosidase [Anaeromicropila populeti]|uniref:alpha-L-fucosidase n=1 Tax=Anaeromicropila populeti TaxID=37658 RepID=A0A1I6J999_9FIRM|nr:alpha-L-fucosidase [Anaeromicropila populeti]SFR75566.1 alpha-L-fucosidase [Anaeromicropila populeti]